MIDFFISYTHADRPWAVWLAWQLEEAGYTTLLVLSPDYLSALFPQPEWAAALAHDPTGRQGTLLPVRVRECTPPGMLHPLLYIDLVGLDEATARDTLLAGLRRERAKPTTAPGFPGSQPRAVPQHAAVPWDCEPPSADVSSARACPHASPCVGVARAEPAMGVEWHWHSAGDGSARLLPDAEA